MSDFQLSTKSAIKEKQLVYLVTKADANAPDELKMERNELLSHYKENAGSPLFQAREAYAGQLPFREDITENMEELVADLHILKGEHDTASRFLVDSFNTVHSEKKRLSTRVQALNNLVGDLLLLSSENQSGTFYFKESFQDAYAFDESHATQGVVKAQIATNEGVLTLGRKETRNLATEARIAHLSGNGTAGIGHLSKKFVTVDREGVRSEAFHFLNEDEEEQHADPAAILDGRPDTLFQYQLVNVPEAFKSARRYYDFEWCAGAPEGETLRLKIIVELAEAAIVNWLSLNPYYPTNAAGKMTVYSIRTSKDGFDYEPLYADKQNLNQELNNTAQTYQLDALFDRSANPSQANYTGQGVWAFPHREARFIEFVLDQNQSYTEILGQEVYYKQTPEQTLSVQVPAPEELKNKAPGEYARTTNGQMTTYKKEIEATAEGWRYAVGIRDIQIMQYGFEEKSIFVSKRYHSDEEIEKLVLYANEIIPENYQDIVSKNNDWIVYEVSFDDTNWTRISPMHHEPLNDTFPPKIIELNRAKIDLAAAFEIHKTVLYTEKAVHDVRMRITLVRPEEEGFLYTTPMVEDFALKIEKKGAF